MGNKYSIDKIKIAAGYGVIAIAAVLVYWPVLSFDFINFDDPIYIVDNLNIQNGLTWASLKWAFSSFYAGNWHPLTWISHIIDWQLYGNFAGGHHGTNLIFHLANCLLLFTFLLRATATKLPSFFVAFLMAVHPVHVESVAWVSERKDVLCAFFVILALLSYLKWVRGQKKIQFALTHLLLTGALLSKPMAVTFPVLLLILDFWPLRRFSTHPGLSGTTLIVNLLKEKTIMIGLCLVSVIITFWAQQSAGAVKPLDVISISARIENALSSYVQYIINIIWPTKLAVFYPFQDGISFWWPIAGALFLFLPFVYDRGRTAVAWRKFAVKFPFFVSGILWYIVGLVPVIGLVQVGNQARADRYMYIPAMGLYIIFAWGIENLRNVQLRKFATAVLGGLLIVLAFVARQQVVTWANSVTLFQHALAVTKNNDTAYTYLANAYQEQGEIAQAKQNYQKALEINPASIEALINFGVLSAKSSSQEAQKIFEQAVRRYPRNPEAHNNLANILKKEGELAQAIEHYKIAIQLKPNYQNALLNLASAYSALGSFDKAIQIYQQCLELTADLAEAHNGLGIALARKGQLDAAVDHFKKSLIARPGYDSAQRNLKKAQLMIENLQSPTNRRCILKKRETAF
jgi:tetratricopeptide (TPR) repeat protein